jgi:hypothetical protein
MKCPVCVEKNLKSSVYPGMSTSTLLWCPPYYDEEGKYHCHDGNNHKTDYNCSQGHVWSESNTGVCPSCDFGKDSKKITIHNSEEKPPITPETIRNISTSGTITYGGGSSSTSVASDQGANLLRFNTKM